MAERLVSDKLVTIFGGPGFVGRYATRELAERGWRIRAASRRPDLAGHLQPMGVVGQIHAVQANLRYPESVAHALAGSDAVVIAVGVLASIGKQTFDALHVDGPRAVAKAAREAGVKTVVFVSAIGADATSSANYAKSKAAGEAAVLEEFPEAVILRPSIVFGPEDQFFNRFAGMAKISPLLPLIGGGKTKFQPVYVGDLALAIANSVEGAAQPGTIYELGGPEILTFRQLLDRTIEWSGQKAGYLPLPFWLAKLQALMTWPLPSGLRPITVDQVRMLQSDNVVSEAARKEGRTLEGLGVSQPDACDVIVPAYLERYKPKGQFAHYRG
ncbi:MAG: complex I NDUFA9 subunit family protein [Pseudomonadota bacterium]